MKNLTNKKILNIFTMCILIFVPLIKFISYYLEKYDVISNYGYINHGMVLYFGFPFLIYVYIKDIKDKKRKLDFYDYLFYILTFVGIISVIFSINKTLAIFGKTYRYEGFIAIMCYYLLFINWKVNGTKEDIKRYINIFFIIGLINGIYGLLQVYTDWPFILTKNAATGFCGHHNFLGALMATLLGILSCKFLLEKIDYKKIILLILFFITLINTQSSNPFIGYIITIIFLIVFLIIKKKFNIKKFTILLLILVPVYFGTQYVNNEIKKMNHCELCSEGIKKSVESGGTGRFKIWENSLDIVKDNFIVGVGFDNFYLAYPNIIADNSIKLVATNGTLEKQYQRTYTIIDNAHNIYLHTLVSNGIIGLVPYLLLCLLTFIRGLKSKDELTFILLSGFVAYSIQAFANISVIQVAPIYYIIIGLILSMENLKKENKK